MNSGGVTVSEKEILRFLQNLQHIKKISLKLIESWRKWHIFEISIYSIALKNLNV